MSGFERYRYDLVLDTVAYRKPMKVSVIGVI